MGYSDLSIANQQIADNLGSSEAIKPILKILNNNVVLVDGPRVVYTRDTSTDSIYGQAIFGTDRWDSSYDNELVINRVTNYNNRYYELFTTNILKAASTTATWNDGLTFSASSTQIAESLSIFKNNEIIIAATLQVTGTGTSGAEYFMSADGGVTWEEVVPGTRHVFTTSGTDLRWKIDNNPDNTSEEWTTDWDTWYTGAPANAVTIELLTINYEV